VMGCPVDQRVGHTIAAIMVAEIGDVNRFLNPQKLCSWAGLTPKHRESEIKVRRGRITNQGSPLVRWAAIEAVALSRLPIAVNDALIRHQAPTPAHLTQHRRVSS
jgi:transposase